MSFRKYRHGYMSMNDADNSVSSEPSGGTVDTLLNIFDVFSVKVLRHAIEPYALSPVRNLHPGPKGSFLSSVTGLSNVPGLGLLTTSPIGAVNAAIVFRTWGLTKQEPDLNKEFYGPNFTYRELTKARNFLTGMLMHYSLIVGAFLVLLPPFRALVRKLVVKPGEGPDKEKAKNDHIELRAVAKPDVENNTDKQISGKLVYTGSMYYRKS